MVETKTLTILLKEVVGEPELRFEAYKPPLEPRELFVAGTTWPELVPKTYDVGEDIKVCFCIKNLGVPGEWTVTVKDLDTGKIIETWVGELGHNVRWLTEIEGLLIGKMPDRDWNLSIKVTP